MSFKLLNIPVKTGFNSDISLASCLNSSSNKQVITKFRFLK